MQIVFSICSSNHLRIKKSVYNEETLYIARSLHRSFRFILHFCFFSLCSFPRSWPLQTESSSFPCPLASDQVQAIAGSNRKSQEGRERIGSPYPAVSAVAAFLRPQLLQAPPLSRVQLSPCYKYSFLPAPCDLEMVSVPD